MRIGKSYCHTLSPECGQGSLQLPKFVTNEDLGAKKRHMVTQIVTSYPFSAIGESPLLRSGKGANILQRQHSEKFSDLGFGCGIDLAL